MTRDFRWTACAALILTGVLSGGCVVTPKHVGYAYDTCSDDSDCPSDLFCLDSSLPASSGFTGASCSAECGDDSDCPQDSNYDAICVNGQCYLSCHPQDVGSGDYCPYSQDCVDFSDQGGNEIDLCTP